MTAQWQVEHLGVADVEGGLALSTEVGWNQTTDDWAYLLRVGQGFGVRAEGGLVATSLALPYPPHFGWVSMVLVTERYRRQGLATLLLQTAINHLRGFSLVPMLDATPEGRALYSQLGFVDIERIDRWQAVLNTEAYRPTQAVTLDEHASLDLSAFGTNRMHLLSNLASRPDSVIACDEGGYAVVRRGRQSMQIGPVVARSPAGGRGLLRQALEGTFGAVIADVPRASETTVTALLESGFRVQRSFHRMALERTTAFGDGTMVHVIAGPELG